MLMLIRRSNLLIPIADAADAWRHGADAVTLDLARGASRAGLKEAIAQAGKGGAEVFVRVDKAALKDDVATSVCPGLHGILLPQVESGAEVVAAAEIVSTLERRRGMAQGSLSFIAQIQTARGVWDSRAIVRARPRVTQVALAEAGLAADLGTAP